jgi:membrane fusion protein
MPLFRTEAAPENNGRYYGVITLRTRWVYWFLSIAVTVFSAAAIALFVYGTYTKRANLQGYLVPTQGITRIHSSMAGRIGEVRVTEGQLVAAGDTLAVVLDERHEFIQTGLDLLFTRSLIDGLGTTQADTMIRVKFERKLAGMGFAPVVKH